MFFDEYGGTAGVTHHWMDGTGYIYFTGATIDATYTLNGYRFMPAICARGVIDPSDAAAFAPDATQYEPEVFVFDTDDGTISQVMIPFEGYAQTGRWTLIANGFLFFMNVLPVDEPTWFDNSVMLNFTKVVLAGYVPNDQVAVINYDGVIDYVTLDENGYGYAVFDEPSEVVLAIVPRSGSDITILSDIDPLVDEFGWDGFHIGENQFDPDYVIPPDITRTLLHDSIWNGQPFDPASWTCPDGLPIRLANRAAARTTADNVSLYSESSFGSDALYTYDSGTDIRMGPGVACSEGAVWWQVHTDEDRQADGWIAESADGEYLLEPA
jgi:hypothetical protein